MRPVDVRYYITSTRAGSGTALSQRHPRGMELDYSTSQDGAQRSAHIDTHLFYWKRSCLYIHKWTDSRSKLYTLGLPSQVDFLVSRIAPHDWKVPDLKSLKPAANPGPVTEVGIFSKRFGPERPE